MTKADHTVTRRLARRGGAVAEDTVRLSVHDVSAPSAHNRLLPGSSPAIGRTGPNSTCRGSNFEYSRKCRHFRRLAATNLVSGEEFWRIRAEGRESRGESLLDEFSISEIWMGSRAETGCVSAETGSNSQSVARGTAARPYRSATVTTARFLFVHIHLPAAGLRLMLCRQGG
jgi:hypothetical protein